MRYFLRFLGRFLLGGHLSSNKHEPQQQQQQQSTSKHAPRVRFWQNGTWQKPSLLFDCLDAYETVDAAKAAAVLATMPALSAWRSMMSERPLLKKYLEGPTRRK